jgi:broad specificity phosphatase PhoE
MAKWYFIRHGESTANLAGRLAGQLDAGLTESGLAQARTLADRLASSSCTAALVLSSDLMRARDTASAVARALNVPVRELQGLREQHLGDWQGCGIAALKDGGSLLHSHEWQFRPPNGETLWEVAHRALRALASQDDSSDKVVVAHKTVLRVILTQLGERPIQLEPIRLDNAQVIEHELCAGVWDALLRRNGMDPWDAVECCGRHEPQATGS